MSFRPPSVQAVQFAGPAGVLEAVVEEPAGAATRFGVICHPHPLHGGTMHNKVVHTLARSLHQRGLPTVRFNFRGVGASAGTHDAGLGEADDVLAAIAWGRERWAGATLVLAGFSFGAVVAMRVAARLPAAGRAADALVTVAPAVDRVYAEDLPSPACPWLLVQGDADEVVATERVLAYAGSRRPPPTLALLPGVGHFFHGALADLQAALLAFIDGIPAKTP